MQLSTGINVHIHPRQAATPVVRQLTDDQLARPFVTLIIGGTHSTSNVTVFFKDLAELEQFCHSILDQLSTIRGEDA